MYRQASHAAVVLALLALAAGFPESSRAQLGRQQGLVEPNTATEQQLQALPGLNAALVQGIVERRPFLSMTDLDSFLGQSLNEQQRGELYSKMFLHLNLNTASEQEILLIPAVGKRMAHEFDEYRPYRSLVQFRKEIGKYVDEKEVARLEQYVFIPINLNTASDQDILSIPGLGQRMLHEFKEYRPYKQIERFRREIGKYVNEKEVARLERYVTVE
jgi:DNA uptake protein ComE-like DNA-binding protein